MKIHLTCSVDLGGTYYRIGIFSHSEKSRKLEKSEKFKVEKAGNLPDAIKTFSKISDHVKTAFSSFDKSKYIILRLLGLSHPGNYKISSREEIDIDTLPNFPSLSEINPSKLLEGYLGKGWKVYCENDAFAQGKYLQFKFFERFENLKSEEVSFVTLTPGTGFGSCLIHKKPISHLYDVVIDGTKTSEDLLSGKYVESVLGKSVRLSKDEEIEKVLKSNIIPNLKKFIDTLKTSKIEKKFIPLKSEEEERIVKSTKHFLLSGFFGKKICSNLILPILKEKYPDLKFHVFPSSDNDTLLASSFLIPSHEISFVQIHLNNIIPFLFSRIEENLKTKNLVVVGIDSYLGIDLKKLLIPILSNSKNFGEKFDSEFLDFSEFFKSQKIIKELIETTSIPNDKTFGVVYDGDIHSILEELKIRNFFQVFHEKNEKNKEKKVVLFVYGLGSSSLEIYSDYFGLDEGFDILMYRDLTREEITKRNRSSDEKKKDYFPSFGVKLENLEILSNLSTNNFENSKKKLKKDISKSTQGPGYLASKSRHYFYFPILDKLRASIMNLGRLELSNSSKNRNINKSGRVCEVYYVDESDEDSLKLISMNLLYEKLEYYVSSRGFQLKVWQDAGIWGGQWLKEKRNLYDLEHLKVNCAWSYELMAYMMSLKVPLNFENPRKQDELLFLEIPFKNSLDIFGKQIIGDLYYEYFNHYFPTRVNYDDNFKGDDMAVQIHPDSDYIKSNFKEPLHQDESYYIIDCDEGAYVHLGIKEEVDINEFRKKCISAEIEKIPFDHRKYVNVFDVKKHDLFLIPAGTVHCSGKGSVVLELSATTDRYTFHFYDYLRPNLHGKLRDIHINHSFNMLKRHPKRRTKFVEKDCIQKPNLLPNQFPNQFWKEYCIGFLKYIVFKVHRIEWNSHSSGNSNNMRRRIQQFTNRDDPFSNNSYHILSLVEGQEVILRFNSGEKFILKYSYSVVIPFSVGSYTIEKTGDEDDSFLYRILKILPNIPDCKDI